MVDKLTITSAGICNPDRAMLSSVPHHRSINVNCLHE